MPSTPYAASVMDTKSGAVVWSVRFTGGDSAKEGEKADVEMVVLQESQSLPGGAEVTTTTKYFPSAYEMLQQEFHNGVAWNGLVFTPTIPLWRADVYRDGVAHVLGENLDDADLQKIEHRFRQHADKDYSVVAKARVQWHTQEIQSALGTSVSFTRECPVD